MGTGTEHRELREGPFWQGVPAYREVSASEFLDHQWQAKNSITSVDRLLSTCRALVSEAFLEDAREGFRSAPMSVRVSPYLLSLIDWSDPVADPIRRQFIPLASTALPDHPRLDMDSLHERADMPVPGLTHRYPDKVLFLALDMCPVYCRFCTRSYAVGVDTEGVSKFHLRVNPQRWQEAFDYISAHDAIEDVVISGGDAYQLRADQITAIGDALVAIPHVRRMRFATKGPAVMPQKLLTDSAWVDALTGVADAARKMGKDVAVHTHFNHPNEITTITQQAMDVLFQRGIFVRNQCVLQCGVNDDARTMQLLCRRLAYVNVHPYYVYQHDMVKGVEELRTPLHVALDVEKRLRGSTAGFNTPTFVVDAPGGGGKRDAHSFEAYDRTTGISVYSSPAVHPGHLYYYFDPLASLPEEGRLRWADPAEHHRMIDEITWQVRA